MLLTITTTASGAMQDASDLGYLLHKHPDRVQQFEVAGGTAHVFYPEATRERCTAALLLEVDPIALVRGRGRPKESFALGQYVNDRPYVASSLLSVALATLYRTAMSGRCDARPALADGPIPITMELPCIPCGGDLELLAALFEPLGWRVATKPIALDAAQPSWGASSYASLTLTGDIRLADALNHLYVLIPVLDDAKHYWVDDSEVDKLVRAGTGWLATHPYRELIARRYLAHQRSLVDPALERLADLDDAVVQDADDGATTTLAAERRATVVAELRAAGARSVLDLGCGTGALLADLLDDPSFTKVTGTDVAHRSLEGAARRLHVDTMSERRGDRVSLLQSSLLYRDRRLVGYDAAVLMEVIEHIEPDRLDVVARNVFAEMRPATVVVTTPNREFNATYPALPPGAMRHRDHRFEWSRTEFATWCEDVCERYGYGVRLVPVGVVDPDRGPATQVGVFTRA